MLQKSKLLTDTIMCFIFLGSPIKAKQHFVENKITHILSIHDSATPGDDKVRILLYVLISIHLQLCWWTFNF